MTSVALLTAGKITWQYCASLLHWYGEWQGCS